MADPSALAAAMQRLWVQFLPQMEQRVATLEAAAAALADGKLTAAQAGEATKAAHNLAGVLGTFGLTEGTTLAREAEPAYAAGLPIDPGLHARLAEIASHLRNLITTGA
jgi:HPt (histidine-containing phosphotransfer) domain-containing protein